jgi:hypothetical protein
MRPQPVRFEVVDDEMAEVLRAKTPAERLAIGFGLWRSARVMLSAMLRSQHPDWTGERVEREVSARLSHGSA